MRTTQTLLFVPLVRCAPIRTVRRKRDSKIVRREWSLCEFRTSRIEATSGQHIKSETVNLETERDVLELFWRSRGIVSEEDVYKLVEQGLESVAMRALGDGHNYGTSYDGGRDLPGVTSTWKDHSSESQKIDKDVVWVSQRIVELYKFLGSRPDVNVVWMVQREPRLLEASTRQLTGRLLELRVDDSAQGIDVAKLAEAQPSLLLEQDANVQGTVAEEEEVQENKLAAWEHGLLSDRSTEWNRSYNELAEYKKTHGDCHVGYRDGDSKRLVKWCGKQRKDNHQGRLDAGKKEKLLELKFEFDEEIAEWKRWYNELIAFRNIHGHCSPVPLASPQGRCTSIYQDQPGGLPQ